jgi:hypothetical protein
MTLSAGGRQDGTAAKGLGRDLAARLLGKARDFLESRQRADVFASLGTLVHGFCAALPGMPAEA